MLPKTESLRWVGWGVGRGLEMGEGGTQQKRLKRYLRYVLQHLYGHMRLSNIIKAELICLELFIHDCLQP